MLSKISTRRSLLAILVAATTTFALGCDDDPAEPEEPEPQVDRIEFTLTAGQTTRTVTVNSAGVQSGVNTFPAGTTTVGLSARFLKADGTVEALVTAADFELRQATGGTAGVTFMLATGQSFQGTISGLTGTGERIIQMQLWHKVENHEDFGPHPLRLQIG
jgi:hypothetical protein